MNSKFDNLYAIILAAGASSRFGSPKQLADWQDNHLLQHIIDITKIVFDKNIIVVLGANVEHIKSTLNKSDITVVENAEWQTGLSSSIRVGIKTLPEHTDAAMILLCDQPLIEKTSLKKLKEAWQRQPDKIIASEYHDTVGVPAIFPGNFFSRLESLQGDKGAKQLLISLKDQVHTVLLPEAGIDIDTLEDFEHLKMQLNT